MGSRKERSSFDWLPAGWKMEVKARNTGKTDRYYIDPVSGYAFRSMNEVFRYLNTGKVGRRAFKPKDRDLMKQKSRQTPPVSTIKTGKLRSLKNIKAQTLPHENNDTESAFSYATDSEAATAASMQTVDLQKLATLFPSDMKERCTEYIFPLVGELVVNLQIENPVEITNITSNQVVEEEDEVIDMDTCINIHNNSDKEDDFFDDVFTWSDEYALEEDEDAKMNTITNMNTSPEHQGLWNDPCIEFAIKTLTGELPIDRDSRKDTMNPRLLMESQKEKSHFSSTGDLEEVGIMVMQQKCMTKGPFSVTGDSSKSVDKEEVGNVVMHQKCLTKDPLSSTRNITMSVDKGEVGNVVMHQKCLTKNHFPSIGNITMSVDKEEVGNVVMHQKCLTKGPFSSTGNITMRVDKEEVGNVDMHQKCSTKDPFSSTGNITMSVNKEEAGNVVMHQKRSTKDPFSSTVNITSVDKEEAGNLVMHQKCSTKGPSSSTRNITMRVDKEEVGNVVMHQKCLTKGPSSSTGNITMSVNKEEIENVTMHEKCSTKGGRGGGGGGGLSWPTFADYRVTQFSWTNRSRMNSDVFQQKF